MTCSISSFLDKQNRLNKQHRAQLAHQVLVRPISPQLINSKQPDKALFVELCFPHRIALGNYIWPCSPKIIFIFRHFPHFAPQNKFTQGRDGHREILSTLSNHLFRPYLSLSDTLLSWFCKHIGLFFSIFKWILGEGSSFEEMDSALAPKAPTKLLKIVCSPEDEV